MAEGIGLREFGRQLGVSGEAIRKAIKTGRIPQSALGERLTSGGRKLPVIMDVEAARNAFQQNTLPHQVARRGEKRDALAAPKEERAENTDGGLETDELPSISDSRKVSEAYKAKMTKLEYEEASGKLVDAEAFKLQFSTLVTTARNRVLAVPSKAKGRIPHLGVDDIEVIRGLLREALEDVARAC